MIGEAPHDTTSRDLPRTDLESWIAAARDGDKHALGEALSSFRNYLLLVADDGLGPSPRAEGGASDLVQETFLRAQRGFANFRGRSTAEWRNWLRQILVHRLADHRRQVFSAAGRARETATPFEVQVGWIDESPTPSRELARQERAAVLMAAVSRLPEHYRRVVIEHHREKLTHEEIGRRRGISAEAARKLWTRALGQLRQEMGPAHEWR